MKYLKRYIKNVLIAVDQLLNVLLTGADEDETISSELGKARKAGKPILSWIADRVDTLFEWLGDPNHCENSIEKAEGKNALPTKARLAILFTWVALITVAVI